MEVLIQRCLKPAGASGASNLEGGAQGLRLVVFARVSESRETLFVESVMSYSFTYFAYSSSGTFSRLAIAICEGVSFTVLRPFGDFDREAVDSAEATLGPVSLRVLLPNF
tara:strand:+ start:1036 stop:1365 length:330 start_codon:yes stop_codon:yes gene_type:complete